MKRISYFAICIIIINVSCSKTLDNVHFHGRVTVACNNQVPVKNIEIEIFKSFDVGSYQDEIIGFAKTDDNGYYSLFADVKQKGSFMYYSLSNVQSNGGTFHIFFDKRGFICSGSSGNNSTNVEMNGTATASKAHGFHIKNVTPFNNADVFNSLTISDFYHTYDNDTLISNLAGANIDTLIYGFFSGDPPVYCKYSYTKNGIINSSVDSISSPNCLDTLSINIFY